MRRLLIGLVAGIALLGAAAPATAQATPATSQPAPAQPAPTKPEAKPADAKPTEAKPTDAKPAEATTADAKSPGLLSPDDAPGPDVLKRTRMPSGLVIDDLKLGEGMPCLPNANITFHAKGFIRGKADPFEDTSLKRDAVGDMPALDGNPISGPVSKLLPGMRDGVIGMQPGGKRRLFIPHALAYGLRGRTDPEGKEVVPGSADLVYEIHLIEARQRLVKPGESADEAKKVETPK